MELHFIFLAGNLKNVLGKAKVPRLDPKGEKRRKHFMTLEVWVQMKNHSKAFKNKLKYSKNL